MKIAKTFLASGALALAMLPAAELVVPDHFGAAVAKNDGDHGGGNGNGGGNGGGRGNGNGGGNKGGNGKSGESKGGGGKGNKGSHGNSGWKSGSSGYSAKSKSAKVETVNLSHGAIASSLKGLNAAHASLNAMAHASPNSRVGRIAAYREALIHYNTATTVYDEALDGYLADLDAYNAKVDAARATANAPYLDAIDDLTVGTDVDPDAVLADLQALPDDATDADIAGVLDKYGLDSTDVTAFEHVTTSDDLDQALVDEGDALDAEKVGLDAEKQALDDQKVEVDDLLGAAASPNLPPEEGTPAYEAFQDMLRLDDGLLFDTEEDVPDTVVIDEPAPDDEVIDETDDTAAVE
jgi:hypothetical protein